MSKQYGPSPVAAGMAQVANLRAIEEAVVGQYRHGALGVYASRPPAGSAQYPRCPSCDASSPTGRICPACRGPQPED